MRYNPVDFIRQVLKIRQVRVRVLNEMELAFQACQIAKNMVPGDIFFLEGNLGAGKTSFVRALLQSLGFSGPVKSPTYSLMESYSFPDFSIHHLDLYRLKDPSELEYLDLEDLLKQPSIFFIEWPEQGLGYLPSPTKILKFAHHPTDPNLRLFTA